MRTRVLSLVIASCACLTGWAQSVKGIVTDAQGSPLEFANIVALTLPDSAFVAGTITDQTGTFSLDDGGRAELLRISSVGYTTRFVARSEQLGTLSLQALTNELGEVVVKGSLPKTRLRGEAMVTTVAGSVLEKAGTLEQLLDRIPNVTAYGGKIEVFGRGTPGIYINGRKMRDQMELERLNADNIKNVEVITNPGARYDAGVKCVIRITTKRAVGDGFGIDAQAIANYNNYAKWSERGRVNVNYRKGGFDLNGTLYLSDWTYADKKTITQYTYLDQTWAQTFEGYGENKFLDFYGKLSLNYMFNPDHSIGASLSYDRYPKSKYFMGLASTVTQGGKLTETSQSLITNPSKETVLRGNIYYTGKIGNWSIDLNTDWYWDKDKSPESTLEDYQEVGEPLAHDTIQTDTRKLSQLVATKLVVTTPLWGGQLEMGGEYSHSWRKTTYTVLPVGILDDDHSRISEGMASAFVQYSRAFGPVNVQAGLRYEHTDFDYYEDGVLMPEQSRVYSEWFPSLALSTTLGKVDLQLAYATDINRPSYWLLRSNVTYGNRYTYESGNPFLLPSLSRNLSFGASWKWMNLSLVYSHISDPIVFHSESYQGDPSIAFLHNVNGDSYDKLLASLTLQPKVGIWSPSLTLAMAKQWYYPELPEGVSLSKPMATVRFNNTIETPWATLSILMNATTAGSTNDYYLKEGSFRTDLSVVKSFLGNKLSVQLDVRDLFCSDRNPLMVYSGSQRAMYYDADSQRNIRLTLRYKLNTTRSKYKGTGAGQSQLNRM